MELREVITVDSSYTRSINLERDRDTEKLTKSYVVTSRSVDLLNRFHKRLALLICLGHGL